MLSSLCVCVKRETPNRNQDRKNSGRKKERKLEKEECMWRKTGKNITSKNKTVRADDGETETEKKDFQDKLENAV